MKKLRVLDLFSGIGGFSLGLERTGGFETVAFCEIEDFPRRVLAKHWPEVPIYDDVRTLTADILERDRISIDVITGGFPCQDISVAGKQAGIADGTRSGLWSEIVRLTRELRPRYVIVENVANLLSGPSSKRGGWFGRVLGDLAECGYDAEWENIPASAVGASHRRERVWIVAHSEKLHCNGGQDKPQKRMGREPLSKFGNGGWSRFMADPDKIRRPEMGIQHHQTDCGKAICGQSPDHVGTCGGYSRAGWWLPEPNVGRGFDGLPAILDGDLSDAAKERASKILHDMRLCDDPQEIWKAAGRFDGVSQAEILLAFLCEYEARQNSGRLAVERETARQECLRNVWKHIELARSSLQSRHNGQHADEFANALRKLSRNSPSLYPQAWQNGFWEDGIKRVEHGVSRRVDRLAALGNAVVPQIPEMIGYAILEVERNMA